MHDTASLPPFVLGSSVGSEQVSNLELTKWYVPESDVSISTSHFRQSILYPKSSQSKLMRSRLDLALACLFLETSASELDLDRSDQNTLNGSIAAESYTPDVFVDSTIVGAIFFAAPDAVEVLTRRSERSLLQVNHTVPHSHLETTPKRVSIDSEDYVCFAIFCIVIGLNVIPSIQQAKPRVGAVWGCYVIC